ncbi:chaperone modulator CbpM [Flavobacteriaceae bacterium TK19130]|nr:chaperone modulator CbpM [Thermobacterium salinum]
MAKEKYILVTTYCKHSNIDREFIEALHQFGLIEQQFQKEDLYILEEDIVEIERMFRLHNDLGINMEGLDVLTHMQRRMEEMRRELVLLKQKLELYE